MSELLYRVIIYPLELIIEIIFCVLYRVFDDPGICLIGISIAVSLLTLPMYNMAERLQNEDNEKRKAMEVPLKHIRKSYSGDERLMIQQALYRIKGYNQLLSLRSLLPLMIQIPFFIAAYHFLSNLEGLKGASFGIISDLSRPDALIRAGGISVNALPVAMTIINILSAVIYLKNSSLQDKIRTWGLAFFFLILLYSCPSGLVLYWTMNNVFSLVKNVVGVFKKPANRDRKNSYTGDIALFLGSVLVMTLLFGLVNPLFVLRKSPVDFIPRGTGISHLIDLIVSTAAVSIGFFLVWIPLLYYMAPGKIRKLLEGILFTVDVIFVVDYFAFGRLRGNMSNLMRYDNSAAQYKPWEIPVNLIVVIVLIPAAALIAVRLRKVAVNILYITIAAFVVIALICSKQMIDSAEKELSAEKAAAVSKEEDILRVSRNGKNVIVLMLDREVGPLFPYIMEDLPELKEYYEGFTYYPNTLSLGINTTTGSGALFGGYEYSEYNRKQRGDTVRPDTQDAALKVMPSIFLQAGYEVTVCDPPLAGGTVEYSDLSIYDDLEGVRAYNTKGMFSDEFNNLSDELHRNVQKRNLFLYGVYRSLPLFSQKVFYHNGTYWGTSFTRMGKSFMEDGNFIDNYYTLKNYKRITDFVDEGNCFLMLDNDTSHNGVELQLPDYEFSESIDNSEYFDEWREKHKDLRFVNDYTLGAYMCDAASLVAVGEWLDYLKSEGVYDNCRIIVVADHGYPFAHFPQYTNESRVGYDGTECNEWAHYDDLESLMPILLVKDFGDREFKVSTELMTNADTPILATKELIDDPVNPFTGKKLSEIENRFTVVLYDEDSRPVFWRLTGDDMYDGKAWVKVE